MKKNILETLEAMEYIYILTNKKKLSKNLGQDYKKIFLELNTNVFRALFDFSKQFSCINKKTQGLNNISVIDYVLLEEKLSNPDNFNLILEKTTTISECFSSLIPFIENIEDDLTKSNVVHGMDFDLLKKSIKKTGSLFFTTIKE